MIALLDTPNAIEGTMAKKRSQRTDSARKQTLLVSDIREDAKQCQDLLDEIKAVLSDASDLKQSTLDIDGATQLRRAKELLHAFTLNAQDALNTARLNLRFKKKPSETD